MLMAVTKALVDANCWKYQVTQALERQRQKDHHKLENSLFSVNPRPAMTT